MVDPVIKVHRKTIPLHGSACLVQIAQHLIRDDLIVPFQIAAQLVHSHFADESALIPVILDVDFSDVTFLIV